MTTTNEDFARKMRRKRIPGVKCIHCRGTTHVDDGAHICAGIPGQRFGERGTFEETHCEAEPLCRNCTHCDECENEKSIRRKAHDEHQEDLRHAQREEQRRNEEKARKREIARVLIEADVEKQRITPATMERVLEHGDPKLMARLFGHLIAEGRVSVTGFSTEKDQFTPQTRFTVQMTGWIEDVLKTAEAMQERDAKDPVPLARAGVTFDLNAPTDTPPRAKVVDPSLVGKIPPFSREYMGTWSKGKPWTK